jgi:hypothetical protein
LHFCGFFSRAKMQSPRAGLPSTESDRVGPPVPSATGDFPTVVVTQHPAETPDFPEAHEDPEQSAELERQQDA